MIYVLYSVVCSVIVSIIIKLARNRGVNTKQLIVWNYPIAVLLTYALFKPSLTTLNYLYLPWEFYIPLSILLPTIFVFIALAIQYSGIVKTEIAMRLSLFIPLLAAFFIFHEELEMGKLAGISVGFLAILFSIGWTKDTSITASSKNWKYPLIVFIGMGVIDVLFKQVAQFTAIPYTTSMFIIFCLAMFVSFLYLGYLLILDKQKFDVRALFSGLLLGVFNFGNILFYMKAHRTLPDNPSVVFTGMNIGVIVLGALVGVLLFKEKLTNLNKIGLLLAVVSVLLIAYL
ncbi:EamA family transporter [Sphingobacterium hungaricum]|uniref:Transporter n=1 Tax=Sphingobacterium hungaricum TaxID=2082723 RepID=A0A928V2E0_9SPHI|nr:EamA/RhaT family transporter [Sphingobacterium hungaricum]MBE8715374.1 transporter [Sphingobacterium hungaricum]